MSNNDIVFDFEKEPNKQLETFILDAEVFLDELVAARHILFYEEIREPISLNMAQLKDGQLAGLRNDLFKPKQEMIEHLETVGLTGDNLKTKLIAYANLRNRLKKTGGTKLAKLLLKAIIKILGSLVGFSKFSEAIKEFVEVLELLMEQAENIENH